MIPGGSKPSSTSRPRNRRREPARVWLLHACIANGHLHTVAAYAYTGAAPSRREGDRALRRGAVPVPGMRSVSKPGGFPRIDSRKESPLLSQRRRALSVLASRIARIALAVASVAFAFVVEGDTSASAATRPACSSVTPKAPTTDPSNPFGPNVTIFDVSESVSTINAALSAHYTPANHQFF